MDPSIKSSSDDDDIFEISDINDISYYRFPYDNLHSVYHTSSSFDMITDNVAIGDWTSSYEPFDVIFNFNYPNNNAQEQQIHRCCVNHKNKEKIIYTIGLYDTTIFNDSLINIFLRLLPHLPSHNGKRILFHCYAGVSRSSTAAIIYYMISTNLSFKSIYDMIAAKRPQICPNPAFIKILNICEVKRQHLLDT